MKARSRLCAALGLAVIGCGIAGCQSGGSTRPSTVYSADGAAGDHLGANVFSDQQTRNRLAARSAENADRTAFTQAQQNEP